MIHTNKQVSVIICTYTEQRWTDLLAAIASIHHQTAPAQEIILVIDHNPHLLQRARKEFSDAIIIENTEARGISGARNCGIKHAQSPVLAFLDDDAIAVPDWLQQMQEGLDDRQVLGVGGAIVPLWLKQPGRWFPEEFLWVVGCTYRGMPENNQPIRNLIGANMVLRREIFEHIEGFQNGIGRIGTLSIGCEETELCIRAQQHWPQGRFLYRPAARVSHQVPAQRTTWRYFCSRCYSEGYSKFLISQRVGRQDSLSAERAYALKTLPKGIIGGIQDLLSKGDFYGILRACAIVLGFTLTVMGYIIGYLFCPGFFIPIKSRILYSKLLRNTACKDTRTH